MKPVSTIFLFLTAFFVALKSSAQIQPDPTHWTFSASKTEANVGDVIEIRMNATIDAGWHMYSSDLNPDIGPIPTTLKMKENGSFEKVGPFASLNPKEEFEEIWSSKVRFFEKKASLVQKIKILKPNPVIQGTLEYQTCSGNSCLPPAEQEFTVQVKTAATAAASASTTPATEAVVAEQPAPAAVSPGRDTVSQIAAAPSADTAVASTQTIKPDTTPETVSETISQPEKTEESLLGFMVAAFLSGLLALLTPCVFPIIPMTVSYFTKQDNGLWKAVLYGLSIIGIYVLVGTVVSRINGPAFANFVSTHWLPNVLFFAIFFAFGLSFLGLFEIVLPSSLVNSMDAKAEKGGIPGILFMAFTLVLVSFSCTGPIVGSLLVASAGGEVLKPIVGMAAFSAAFAIPFTLFAAFPQWLKSLPKSGGWLNSVKVVLGFLELALALKFLSVADQVYHWNLLDREVYLSFWIVIFSLIGFYLLGKVRLPHDSETKTVSVPRLLLAIVTFAFVVYMIPGLWGAPLKALAGYLPPETTQDFGFRTESNTVPAQNALTEKPKYSELFRLPHGLQGFFDYEQALAYAQKVNKPIFIDFTGHGCVNCREMEARVWSEEPVLRRLQNEYVILALYVDDKTELPESEWYTSTYDKKQKKTIGAQNADLQIVRYNNNAQPHYCLVDHDGKLLVQPKNYDLNVDNFAGFLDEGKRAFAMSATARGGSSAQNSTELSALK
ncbi:thiol:disulfide interchange protein DsbD [Larkinella arboricola]|uniref:Thiol:disulfide interchange protein DsbD n=1 Tax=Larkinella arboricola TaxID=643671 RepID=A0A327X4U4_LARAB|nr:cytochrome c biogenesis protein CcdA [Larkinella arboricola]RAK02047.1 thiol:disulfide interchange protein DsbD [Larkinella arboricola]